MTEHRQLRAIGLMLSALGALAALGTLSGCASLPGTTPTPPTTADARALPAQWPQAAAPGTAALQAEWWRALGDTQLDALIAQALKDGASVRQARARLDEARAALRLADAQRLPLVSAQLGASRSASSGALPPNPASVGNVFNAGVSASWEPDVWGRLGRESQAAQADVAAAQADADAVALLLAAEVARNWFNLRALDQQIRIVERTLAQQREALALQQRRAQAGLLSDFEIRQLQAEIAGLVATLPPLSRAREQTQVALLLLSGQTPEAITRVRIDTPQADAPAVPARLPDGLPSELLLRRPDLAQARARMLAADARAEAIRLSAFPQVALTASAGTQAARLSDLFSGPAFVWSLGASVAQTLFEGGRREATSEVMRARQQQALLAWQAAVAQAFADVRGALAAQDAAVRSGAAQRERIAALQQVLDMARLRFTHGVASQLDVLDAQRALLAAQAAAVEADQAQRLALVDVIVAMGGGWTSAR